MTRNRLKGGKIKYTGKSERKMRKVEYREADERPANGRKE